MDGKIENVEAIVQFWRDSADKDYSTMHNLLKTKDNSWALFIGHLVIEKLLKALYVKKLNQHPIFTHDLLRLAAKTELILTDEREEWLDTISTFNINARYDSYKRNFQQLCTMEFAKIWIDRIENIRKWLIKQL